MNKACDQSYWNSYVTARDNIQYVHDKGAGITGWFLRRVVVIVFRKQTFISQVNPLRLEICCCWLYLCAGSLTVIVIIRRNADCTVDNI